MAAGIDDMAVDTLGTGPDRRAGSALTFACWS
jgi:hypothetical protein